MTRPGHSIKNYIRSIKGACYTMNSHTNVIPAILMTWLGLWSDLDHYVIPGSQWGKQRLLLQVLPEYIRREWEHSSEQPAISCKQGTLAVSPNVKNTWPLFVLGSVCTLYQSIHVTADCSLTGYTDTVTVTLCLWHCDTNTVSLIQWHLAGHILVRLRKHSVNRETNENRLV